MGSFFGWGRSLADIKPPLPEPGDISPVETFCGDGPSTEDINFMSGASNSAHGGHPWIETRLYAGSLDLPRMRRARLGIYD